MEVSWDAYSDCNWVEMKVAEMVIVKVGMTVVYLVDLTVLWLALTLVGGKVFLMVVEWVVL